MNNSALSLLEPDNNMRFLGTDETMTRLNEITQEAKEAHQKLLQKNRRSNLGSYFNTFGPYTLIVFCGGYLAKRGIFDHKISFYDIGFSVFGTTSSLFWFLKKEKIQQQLGGKVETAQKNYNTTLKTLREKFGEIVGTTSQQKRTYVQEEQKVPTPKKYALKDIPKDLPSLMSLSIKRELIQLKEARQQLNFFAKDLGRYWIYFDSFINRNSPGNRNSLIVSDGAGETDEEKIWATETGEEEVIEIVE